MYIYKDVLGKLKKAGYSSYRLLYTDKLLPGSTIQKLRDGSPLSLVSLDRICQLLHCQLSDIVEIKFDDEPMDPDAVTLDNKASLPAADTREASHTDYPDIDIEM